MKRFISLFLVVSVLALSIPLTAKERKGADLLIQKTDGTQVRGELIAVKENSLLLLDRDTGADVTVDVGDIRVITIVKKSKALLGAGIGLLIGCGLGVVIGQQSDEYWMTFAVGVGFGVPAILIGILVGSLAGKDKTIQFEGKSDSEIQEILEKLRKKARIKNSQ